MSGTHCCLVLIKSLRCKNERAPAHMAAAVAPTRHGVLGMTRITLAFCVPRASRSVEQVTPAAIETTSLFASTPLFSESTRRTYCGLVATNRMSAFSQTCKGACCGLVAPDGLPAFSQTCECCEGKYGCGIRSAAIPLDNTTRCDHDSWKCTTSNTIFRQQSRLGTAGGI